MKRFFTLLLVLAASLNVLAQTPANSRRPLWVGLDMGGTWQTSDMKARGGIGWSFTLSRYSKLDKTGPLYFGWRFRFLDGRNYGYNYHRLYGISANPVLSSGATNYATPTANNDGYVFSNYKMRFDEFAYELIIGSNGLRKHGVLLYGFGGIGLTHWKTTINQLDNNLQRYDYSSIDMAVNGNDDALRGNLEDLWRLGDYETVAQGSTSSGKWNFMPSAGVGFGYQWSNAVAIGVEHRTTWALNDLIDGVNHNHTGEKTPNNDVYNYDGFFVRWTFGGHGNSSSNTTYTSPPPANPNTYTPNPTPTNTVVVTNPNTNPPNTNPPTNPPNNQPQGYPPNVRFITPSVEPYTANVVNQQLVVRVENVTSSGNIRLMINNQYSTAFSYNPSTNTMVFSHTLQNGVNTYQVTGTNQFGSASDVQTIYYNTTTTVVTDPNPAPSALPPQVTITNPSADPYTSAVQTMNVTATVLNVTTVAGVQVRRNGSPVTNFSFDPYTHQVNFVASLQNGSNMYEVIGTNSVGSASDHTTINYNPVAPVQPPVVTITSPSSCPYSVKASAYTITANVTNVTMASQVAIIFNNQPVVTFNFVNMGSYAQVSFPVTLNQGSNPFTITGTNAGGSNSKSCDINYKVTTAPVALPPVVNINVPAANPFNTTIASCALSAQVLNVTAANQITVRKGNQNVTFNYNANANLVTFTAALLPGTNVYTVTATNAVGAASDNTTVIYTVATSTVVVRPPSGNPNTNSDPVDPPTGNDPQDPNPQDPNTGNPNTNDTPVGPPGGNGPQNPGTPPSITLISPSSQNSNAASQTQLITMNVFEASSISEITVRVNNAVVGSAIYNAATHLLSFTATFVGGANTIQVSVQTANGNASTSLTVTYTANIRTGGGNTPAGGNRNGGSTTTPKSTPRTSSAKPETTTKPATTTTTTTTKPATTTPATTEETKPETTPSRTPSTTTTTKPEPTPSKPR
ncbi:hypothetical protein BH11BAC7_BH11BAC7_14630 [soil metagenome]